MWLRRMLFRSPAAAEVPPAVSERERADLEAARRRHVALLGRADQAIRTAMDHADAVFVPRYRGPERRRVRR